MVATISTRTLTATHDSLKRSISDYTAGQLSKQDISRLLAKALELDPACGSAIQEFLDRELRGRRLSFQDHGELTAGLNIPPSENVPTETSEGVPDRSGLYVVDQEGTLVLANDSQPESPPPLADELPLQAAPVDKVVEDSHAEQKISKPPGLKVGSILRERFRLDEEVASGSMGLVYRATDLLKLEAGAMSPVVAVKVINPKFANDAAALKSFQNEVANTQHLSHPNIIHLFEIDKHDGHFFMTMEWLEGESLDTLLDRSMGSALPPVQAYAIIEQLCDALAYAHARNVVHADIKPGNVFLTKPGELKLIDFGIAHFDDMTNIGNSANTEKQTVALTPAYASCEALEKQKPTAQDDLFSLACLVYRLLCGRRAFGSMTALQAEAKGVEVVAIGGMSESRWQALSKALSFRRGGRQPDVNTFAEEFGQRKVPRPYEVEADEAAFTETMTLQALPEGLDLSGAAMDDSGKSSTASVRDDNGIEAVEADKRIEAVKAYKDIEIVALEDDDEPEIDPELFPDATAITPVLNDFESVEEDAEPDDLLIADFAMLEDRSESPAAHQPAAEPDDLVFTETIALEAAPENLEATTSDTVNLEETAPLGAVNFSEGIDLLGTDLIGEEPAASEVNAASADTQDLGDLPDPINFFDADCDDSVFVPVEDSQSSATSDLPDATDKLEVLPDDCSFVEGGAAEPPAAAKVKPPAVRPPAKPQPVQKSAASAPAKPSGQRAATKPANPPATAKPVRAPAPAKPAAAAAAKAEEQVADNAKSDAPRRLLESLTGAGQSKRPSESAWLERIAGIAPAKTLQVGGAIAALFAVLAIGAWWFYGAVDPATSSAADQSPQLAATNSRPAAPPAAGQKPAVRPTELFVSRGSQGESAQSKAPVRAADAGIAAGDAVVAVPLSLASQSANGGLPSGLENNLDAVPPARATPRPRADRPVTVGYMIGLHNLARQALAAGNLTEPSDASAMVWVDEMRANEPNSKETLDAQAQLADGLLQRAAQAVSVEDADAAERWAGLAEKYAPDKARLKQIQQAVAELRMRLERATGAVTADNTAADTLEQDAADTEAAELNIEIPVPLSAIEFTRYAEPVFPSQLLNKTVSGWVDVRFTIGVDGETRDVEVTGSDLPPDFAAPSIAAVDGWSFKPYMHNGEVVPVNSAVRLNYAN